MFIYNTYDTLNQLIALYLVKFKHELLLADLNNNNTDFIYRFGEALFTGFNELPMFRVRSLIRYALKTCLTACATTIRPTHHTTVVVKLNQVLLEYFLPSILAKVNAMNKHYGELKQLAESEEPAAPVLDDSDDQDEALNSQIIEENQFILLCRDVVDLVRVFVLVNYVPQAAQPASQLNGNGSNQDESNEMSNENEENSGEMSSNVESSSAASASQISELAVHLLKSSRILIYFSRFYDICG
jgi:hypothetical protein